MVHGRKLGAWWKLATFLSVSRQCNGVSCAWLIPATAIVLRGVKFNDIIADYGKDRCCGSRKEEICQGLCDAIWAPGCSRRSYVISKVPAYKQSNCSIITILIHIFAYPKILHIQRGLGPIAFGYARVYCICVAKGGV